MELILERRCCWLRGTKQGGVHSVSSFRAEALGTGVPKETAGDDRLVSQLIRSRRLLRDMSLRYIVMTALAQCLQGIRFVS
jgi:hypothetical protein